METTAGPKENYTERPHCGGYQILRTLGQGGNAVVKLVEGAGGRRYAMKIFEPHADDKANFVEATRSEVELVQQLDIEDVPKYYEFNEDAVWQKKNGEDKNCCYILMELVQGVELIDFFNSAQHVSKDEP